MRGTIFKHKDPNRTPRFATLDPQLSDVEIYEAEKQMIVDGWEPVPTAEELFTDNCPNCGYPLNINGQHWGEPIKADDSAER